MRIWVIAEVGESGEFEKVHEGTKRSCIDYLHNECKTSAKMLCRDRDGKMRMLAFKDDTHKRIQWLSYK